MFGYLCDSEILVCFQITLIPGGFEPILGESQMKENSRLAVARHDHPAMEL